MRDTIVWLSVLILAASATTEEQQNKTEESKKQDKRGILVLGYVPGNFHNNNLGFSSIVLHNAAKVPFNTVTQQVPVHVPQPVPVPIRRPVPVPIPAPYTVNVPRPVPVPVPQAVPITVVRPVPVEVNRPVAIPVPHPVHVPVPQPYNVPVPHPIPVPDSSENQDSPGAEGDSGSNAEFGVKIIDSTKQTHDSLHNNAGSDDSANHNLASSQGHNYYKPTTTTSPSHYNLASNTVSAGHSASSGDYKLNNDVGSKIYGSDYVSNYNIETLKYVQGAGYNPQYQHQLYNSNYGNNAGYTISSNTGTKTEDSSAHNYLSPNLKEGIAYGHAAPGTSSLAQSIDYHKGTGEESEKSEGYKSGQSQLFQSVPPQSQTDKSSGQVPNLYLGHSTQSESGYLGYYPGYNLRFNLEPTGETHAENSKQEGTTSNENSKIPQSVSNFEKSHDSGITQIKYISNYAPETGHTDVNQGHFTGSPDYGRHNNGEQYDTRSQTHSQSSATETQKSTITVQNSNLYKTEQSSTFETQSTGQHKEFPKQPVQGTVTHNTAYNPNLLGYSQGNALGSSSGSHNPINALGSSQQHTANNKETQSIEYVTLTRQGHDRALNEGRHETEYQQRLTTDLANHGQGAIGSSQQDKGPTQFYQHTIGASENGHSHALRLNVPIHTTLYNTGRSGHEPGYTTIGTRSSPLSSEYGTGSAGREQGHINAGSPHQHQGHISSGSPHQDQGHTSHSSGEGDTFGYYTGIIVHGHPNKPASGSNIIGHDSGSSSQNAQGITSRLAHKIEHGYSGNSQADYKPEYQAVRNENNHSSGSALNTLESENIKNYQTASQSQITVQDARYDVGSYHSTQATEDTVSEAR